jgi:hypothetical protein
LVFLGYFGDGVSWTICSGWPQVTILLIWVFQVARIAGMSHQHPAGFFKGTTTTKFWLAVIKWQIWNYHSTRQTPRSKVNEIHSAIPHSWVTCSLPHL